jgi:hypothetical protein
MDDRYFVGGMNIEFPIWWIKRTGTGIPFARMRVHDGGVSIGYRWPSMPGMPKALRSFEIPKTDIAQVFRSRGIFIWGVGFETTTSKTHFFLTFGWRKVLTELADRGYAIGADRRPGFLYAAGLTSVASQSG